MYKGEEYKMDFDMPNPINSLSNYMKDGCYYISPEICKDIIIDAGVIGVHMPKAVKKIRYQMDTLHVIEDVIPAFRLMQREVMSSYSSELAESLVKAAGSGKGLEIVIGYPKVLICSVK
ncbi:MAG: hypothetical protein K0S47_1555 [Herbinix sp.]|jgi:hypothetical protein|nr:hypothetical protein [Herbinix sp.]